MSVETRVRTGCALLDDVAPGWFLRVKNIEGLNIASTESCVLAQVFGSWERGKKRTGLVQGFEQARHGFNFAPIMSLITMGRDLFRLNEEWRSVIRARQVEYLERTTGTPVVKSEPKELIHV